jgi:DNA-binding NtrC family response regulator
MSGKIKLLFVDDEIKFLHSMAKRLELRGFDVTTAESGQDAIAHAEKGRFELAVLDLKMPGIDGKNVLEILKKKHDFIEVIIMTGHGSADAAAECMRLGAFSYLPKPYELEKILEVLRQAYATRLKKKYRSDPGLKQKLDALDKEQDSIEALRAMKELVP